MIKKLDVPKEIFLQICPEHGISCGDVTWCVDRVNGSDVRYVLPARAAQLLHEPRLGIQGGFTCEKCGCANSGSFDTCVECATPRPS